jgi:hypothetical protein
VKKVIVSLVLIIGAVLVVNLGRIRTSELYRCNLGSEEELHRCKVYEVVRTKMNEYRAQYRAKTGREPSKSEESDQWTALYIENQE